MRPRMVPSIGKVDGVEGGEGPGLVAFEHQAQEPAFGDTHRVVSDGRWSKHCRGRLELCLGKPRHPGAQVPEKLEEPWSQEEVKGFEPPPYKRLIGQPSA